jgi:ureidoglycolate dehydrogenase (NAD+)
MKGAGMSLAFGLLTSVLSGQPILAPIHNKFEGVKRYRQNAVMICLFSNFHRSMVVLDS